MAASTFNAPPNKPPETWETECAHVYFDALKSDGSNYLKWSSNAKMHMVADDVSDALVLPTPAHVSPAAKA